MDCDSTAAAAGSSSLVRTASAPELLKLAQADSAAWQAMHAAEGPGTQQQSALLSHHVSGMDFILQYCQPEQLMLWVSACMHNSTRLCLLNCLPAQQMYTHSQQAALQPCMPAIHRAISGSACRALYLQVDIAVQRMSTTIASYHLPCACVCAMLLLPELLADLRRQQQTLEWLVLKQTAAAAAAAAGRMTIPAASS
jgi:hypothetical protein